MVFLFILCYLYQGINKCSTILNYLAHIYLSGEDRQVQLGNFIGDAVKGNAYNNYPEKIKQGILLHRHIDDFSDRHPLVKEAVALLKNDFGRYSGVLVDIFFDHFLAVDFHLYSKVSLQKFTAGFYFALIRHYRYLPPRIRRFLWHFILTNRLGCYAFKEGIRKSLEIMVAYKNLHVSPSDAVMFLTTHYDELHVLFERFFIDLIGECRLQETGSRYFKISRVS